MKRKSLLVILLFTMLAVHSQNVLLQFGKNNFEGWMYNGESVINNQSIGNDLVALYGDYVLVSPMFNATGVDNITVEFTGRSRFGGDESYNPVQGSPTLQLIDENGDVVKEQSYLFTTHSYERFFTVGFDINDVANRKFKLRLACPDANIDMVLSVRKVVVYADADPVPGDVDNDGTVTSADVTAIYNYLLNNDDSSVPNGDQDGDGIITAGDVTIVYNVLLGN